MLVVHANWTGGRLRMWAESLSAFRAIHRGATSGGDGAVATAPPLTTTHVFAASCAEVAAALAALLAEIESIEIEQVGAPGTIDLRLPAAEGTPAPGDRLAAAAGVMQPIDVELHRFEIPCITLAGGDALRVLIGLDGATSDAVDFGHDLRYWLAVGRFATDLLVGQRFIPSLQQSRDSGLRAHWQPWLHDEDARARAGALIRSMPPIVRAIVDDDLGGRPWPILEQALRSFVDDTVRQFLVAEEFALAIEDRDVQDPHVAWLRGLLAGDSDVRADSRQGSEMLHAVSGWVGRLDASSQSQPLRLRLTLHEPEDAEAPEPIWRMALQLMGTTPGSPVFDAEQIWGVDGAAAGLSDLQTTSADEFLLTELRRAGRIYPRLEAMLDEPAPTGLDLTTAEAYALLNEFGPLLEESGVVVIGPEWWDDPASQLGVRMVIHADEQSGPSHSTGLASTMPSNIGLKALVRYEWQVAIGDHPLSAEEFDLLARQAAPITRVGGRWVRLRADHLDRGSQLMRDRPGGEVTLLDAIQLAHGVGHDRPGLPVLGLDADGWVADLLEATSSSQQMPDLSQPTHLRGELRPYQLSGLSWLAFLDQLGLGACLADDMGLGKTVQLIALLQHEREQMPDFDFGPSLLLVPTSLIGNWTRELERFAPELRFMVHHGPDRAVGDAFDQAVGEADLLITTYGLVTRDRDMLQRVSWHRVVLDEAQYIKNPPTKQTSAIRALRSRHRVALTGTPVENRLSEMWSIMEFCNPGYLGAPADFRRRFAIPIERHRDPETARVLRQLVRPFILRRLKTDPTVIDDLPPCVQTKEFANLTVEQATLYKEIVDRMLVQVESAEGMQRRGLVLSTLVRLKQVCDHPELLQEKGGAVGLDGNVVSSRSGKSKRLVAMLEEILASNERSLIFTQFRRMGHLLSAMLHHELDTEVMFLHGGTPQARRQQMIDRFQDPRGDVPIFVLSLKAGGVGLNLTAANHVFHFDRWWNPAVENQATDRAFRIGQTKTVHVHKFVCVGTLEERIDQMIEQKTELAENIIGSGEDWLTELTSGQLRDILELRQSAMEQDS